MNPSLVVPFDEETQAAIVTEVLAIAPLREGFLHADLEHSWPHTHYISRDDLRAMAALQDLFFTHHFSSHRRWLGSLIVFGKRIAIAFLNKLLSISLVRQVELNQHVWNLALTVHHLEQRLQHLERQALRGPKDPST